MQVDYLMSRLSSLEGKIGGTEMQLNLELDHRSALTLRHMLYMPLFGALTFNSLFIASQEE